jgi:hypothetical protein
MEGKVLLVVAMVVLSRLLHWIWTCYAFLEMYSVASASLHSFPAVAGA